jgi:glycosyltransferase involved in cell wall biosynthesis
MTPAVGMNLLGLTPGGGGAARYAVELARALREAAPDIRLVLFTTRSAPADLAERVPGSKVVTLPLSLDGRLPWTLPWTYAGLPVLAAAQRLDVLHGPFNVSPGVTPGVRRIVTVLDLIWWHMPHEWEADARAHRAIRRQTLYSLRHAHRVLTISQTSARDLVQTLGLPQESITVTPLGVSERPRVAPLGEDELRARHGLGRGRVLLSVAQRRPYKNLPALVRALPGLPDDVVLVLAGAPTAHDEELRALAGSLAVSDRLRLLGYVDDAELEGLYALASAFALMSRIEGFGLPALEAMRRGVPVVVSAGTALEEVVGDAGLTVALDDDEALRATLTRVLDDPGELAARGRERAAGFTWRRTAELTLEAYRAA